MDTEERLIAEAAQANRALGASGQSDMVWGHASVRDPRGRGAWMKAAGWSFDEVTPARVALVSPSGEVLAGDGPRHIEYPIHTEVMNARPDVGSVVHTHAPAAVSFAALDLPLRAISHDGVEFADPQVARFTLTGSLINTTELGQELARTIGDGVGCLIPQHGLVSVGPDPATAVMRAVLLARACHVQLQAMAAGEIVLWSDPAEIALKKALVWQESQINAGYAFLCRQADGAAAGELFVERRLCRALLARAFFGTDKVPSARDGQGSQEAPSRVKGTLSSERITCVENLPPSAPQVGARRPGTIWSRPPKTGQAAL